MDPRRRATMLATMLATILATCAALLLAVGVVRADSTTALPRPTGEPSPRQPRLALALVGGVYASLYGYAYLAWYRTGRRTERLIFRDEGWFEADTYAGGADKLGHLWSNHALTRTVSGILRWGGLPPRTSLLTSAALTLGFFTVVELKDGYEPGYGFSWGDMLFNVGGILVGAATELWPTIDETVDFRLEYWPSRAFVEDVKSNGFWNGAEDYTGQRFLIVYHLASIAALRTTPGLKVLSWLDLDLGFRALHYRPPEQEAQPRQEVFLGISVNLQRIVAWAFGCLDEDTCSTSARALRFTTDVIGVPWTTVGLARISREGERLP